MWKNKTIYSCKETAGMKSFRLHQTEAIQETNKENKGFIVLPTGTSKSLIEYGIISNNAKEKVSKSRRKQYILERRTKCLMMMMISISG